jgi:signal transduction histidine kinase
MSAEPTSAELLAKLLTSTPDGLLLVDLQGVVLYANPAAETLFGRAPSSLAGQPFGLPHVAGIRDVELVHGDGGLRTVEMLPVETTWEGERVWVIALRDATEQRRREQRLRTELEASSDLTDELTHELGTTLAVVIGFAETAERHWEQLSDDQRRELFHRIGIHGHRLQRMLRRMQLADSMQPGTAEPHLEPVDLWEAALAHLPDLGGPSVHIECPRDVRVQADIAYVDEIVANLVENAAKYGAPPITIRAHRTGDVVELAVSDHGPGVDENFVPRLFERYSQADDSPHSTGAGTGTGTGLGLFLVQKLALACGGDVRYEPNEPQGARFIVTLPAV